MLKSPKIITESGEEEIILSQELRLLTNEVTRSQLMQAVSLGRGCYTCHAPKWSNMCMHAGEKVRDRQTGRGGEKEGGRGRKERRKRGHNGLKTATVRATPTSLPQSYESMRDRTRPVPRRLQESSSLKRAKVQLELSNQGKRVLGKI